MKDRKEEERARRTESEMKDRKEEERAIRTERKRRE